MSGRTPNPLKGALDYRMEKNIISFIHYDLRMDHPMKQIAKPLSKGWGFSAKLNYFSL